MIRSLRELTLRAACGRLSRGAAALGSNPVGYLPSPPSGNQKSGQKGLFFGLLAVEEVLRGGCSVIFASKAA